MLTMSKKLGDDVEIAVRMTEKTIQISKSLSVDPMNSTDFLDLLNAVDTALYPACECTNSRARAYLRSSTSLSWPYIHARNRLDHCIGQLLSAAMSLWFLAMQDTDLNCGIGMILYVSKPQAR